jgi:hypothetical protein
MSLMTKESAWRMLELGLGGAGFDTSTVNPKYYKIPKEQSRLPSDVWIILVEIPSIDPRVGNRFLGVEMQNPNQPIDSAVFGRAVVRDGAQFSIDFSDNVNTRSAFVWRK